MIRLAVMVAVLSLAGCASVPHSDPQEPAGTLPVVEPIHGSRIVYVPVETTKSALRECLAAKRAEAAKKSRWQQYAERLERLLGIDSEGDDK